MIARQFLSWQFGLTFGAALLLAGAFALAARHYNKTGNKTFSAGSFREPIGYLMSAIGVLVPLIAFEDVQVHPISIRRHLRNVDPGMSRTFQSHHLPAGYGKVS